MKTDLRHRLSAIDPAQHHQAYSPAEQELLVQRIISSAESRPPLALAGSQRDQLRPRRRMVMFLSTAATAVAVALVSQGLPTSSAPTDSRPRAESADLAGHDAAAVTLALQKLAATVTGPAPTGEYLYTRTRLKEVGLDRPEAKQGEQSFRYVSTTTIQSWQGTTCNDRITETRTPLTFPSVGDRQAALVRSRDTVYLRELIDGVTTTWAGADARSLDDIPCDRLGRISHPNPPYIATYPSTADAFLAKVRRDLAADPEATEISLEAGLMGVLKTPWLSDLQRAAGLRAFAQVPGQWKVSGSETVAGIRGLRVVRSVPGTGIREELVLAGRAPGVLRRTEILTDLSTADRANRTRLEGLAPGTVTFDLRILSVATVPNLPTER